MLKKLVQIKGVLGPCLSRAANVDYGAALEISM